MLVPSLHQLGPQTAIEEIVEAYKAGVTLKSLCVQTRRSYACLRRELVAREVEIRGPGLALETGSVLPSAKLNPEARRCLEEELIAGHRHAQLARRYGVSRERVRQIAKRIGTPTGRQLQVRDIDRRQAKAVKRREEAQERRNAKKEAFYAPWREMWAAGMPVKEMAARLGLSVGSIGVRTVGLRKQYPEWFPRRASGPKRG